MNIIDKANLILNKYGLHLDYSYASISRLLNVAIEIFSQVIDKLDHLILDEEHITLFDAFWYLGNQIRGTDVRVPDNLKIKIIANRLGIDYEEIVIGNWDGTNMKKVLNVLNLTKKEQIQIWEIFHKVSPELSKRNSDKVDYNLGIYKLIDHKIKWLRKTYVMDLGCGSDGTAISTLVEKYENKVKGYGVDLDVQQHSPNAQLVKADINSLPFEDNFFDVAYSKAVMGYFSDEQISIIIKEVLRVLKSRGYFVFDDGKPLDKYANEIIPSTGFKAKIYYYARGGAKLIVKD